MAQTGGFLMIEGRGVARMETKVNNHQRTHKIPPRCGVKNFVPRPVPIYSSCFLFKVYEYKKKE